MTKQGKEINLQYFNFEMFFLNHDKIKTAYGNHYVHWMYHLQTEVQKHRVNTILSSKQRAKTKDAIIILH